MRNTALKTWMCRLSLNQLVSATTFHASSSESHIRGRPFGNQTRALADYACQAPYRSSGPCTAAISSSLSYSNSVCNVSLSP